MDSYTLPSPELQAEMALEYLLQKMTMMIIFIQKISYIKKYSMIYLQVIHIIY